MFGRKKKEPTSPRHGLIRPPGEQVEAPNLPTIPFPISPIQTNKTMDFAPPGSPATSPKRKAAGAPKVVLKPGEESEDNAVTQQELQMGKGVLRPVPVKTQKKQDIFSRISFRKLQPVNPPAQMETPEANRNESAENDNDSSQPNTPVSVLENSSEVDVIARLAERRGWGKRLPTNNPHCMHALLKESNPFKRVRHVSQATVGELTAALETTIYCSPKSLSTAGKYRFHRNDVVVVGCPRSGQTPVLQILASLKTKQFVSANGLLDLCSWLEGPFRSNPTHSGRRILKTHMPLRLAMRGEHGKAVEHKIIVVMRDPLDVRLSWFRHVRRLVKKCAHQSIDQTHGLSSFVDEALPLPLAEKTEMDLRCREPEAWIAWALKYYQEYPECVLPVFYEELLYDPLRTIERICEFTKCMEEVPEPKRRPVSSGGADEETEGDKRLKEIKRRETAEIMITIANGLLSDPSHPNMAKRNGSSGQGAVCFAGDALEKFDSYWDQIIGPNKLGKYASYQHLYQSILKQKYVFGTEIAATGSSLIQRLSNLSSSVGGESKVIRGDSLSNSASSSSRLKRQESSADESKGGRKGGGSFLGLFGAGTLKKDRTESSGSKGNTPDRPVATTLPRVYFCVDPDDSDDEVSKELTE